MAKRDLILHNFWWKVTSFLLAIIVWFVVRADNDTTLPSTRRVFAGHPLAVMRDSTDQRQLRITPTEVDVIVTAPVMEATRLAGADIQTFIDLTEVDQKHKTARIHVFVPTGRGVRLQQITPDEATIEFLE
jgi:YbbR domain-containing protein